MRRARGFGKKKKKNCQQARSGVESIEIIRKVELKKKAERKKLEIEMRRREDELVEREDSLKREGAA